MDNNPNAGENQTHYSGGSDGTKVDGSGVGTGLSHSMKCSVKNAEGVSKAQRPKARREKAGSFSIGL